jgi:hypothetical protein
MNIWQLGRLSIGDEIAVDVSYSWGNCNFAFGTVTRSTKNKLTVTVLRNNELLEYSFSKITGHTLGGDKNSYGPNVGMYTREDALSYIERKRVHAEERLFMQDTRNTLKGLLEGSIDDTLAAKLRELADKLDARYVTVMEEVA